MPIVSRLFRTRKTGKLSQKQVRALSRALKRQGRKLPSVDRCARIQKIGGKYDPTLVASTRYSTSEVCHYKFGDKHIYTVWARPRERGR